MLKVTPWLKLSWSLEKRKGFSQLYEISLKDSMGSELATNTNKQTHSIGRH